MQKIYVFLLLMVSLLACKGENSKGFIATSADDSEVTTTYYFIRHAEKDLSNPSNQNPDLTPEGEARSTKWKRYFADKGIDAVFSTNYLRTIKTATPTAEANNLVILDYDPNNLYSDNFKKATVGKTVLVVGHSNTTPAFVNAIVNEDKYPEIDESVYGTLYKVVVTGTEVDVEGPVIID